MPAKNGQTQRFSVSSSHEIEVRKILGAVYSSLVEKGYDPINQISGYILTGDPTYITNFNNARTLIATLDRDELMNLLIKNYLRTEN